MFISSSHQHPARRNERVGFRMLGIAVREIFLDDLLAPALDTPRKPRAQFLDLLFGRLFPLRVQLGKDFRAKPGALLLALAGPVAMRWILGASFLAMAAWTLVPDHVDEGEVAPRSGHGVFLTTVVAFFLAEMGDKTQIATVALAAKYASAVAVVAGTTLGMMLANVPAVYFGDRIAGRLSTSSSVLKLVHGLAALVFAVLGIATLFGAGRSLGF